MQKIINMEVSRLNRNKPDTLFTYFDEQGGAYLLQKKGKEAKILCLIFDDYLKKYYRVELKNEEAIIPNIASAYKFLSNTNNTRFDSSLLSISHIYGCFFYFSFGSIENSFSVFDAQLLKDNEDAFKFRENLNILRYKFNNAKQQYKKTTKKLIKRHSEVSYLQAF